MLVARGEKVLREASFRWALVFTRGAWFKIVETEGLAFDTRFVPPEAGAARDQAALYVMARGSYDGFGVTREHFTDRTCMVMHAADMEGANGQRHYAYRAAGTPHAALELHFASADVTHVPDRPQAIQLDEDAWTAATRAALLSESDDERIVEGLRGLLRGLARAGVLRSAAAERVAAKPSPTLQRLWQGVKPMVERFAVAVTMDELGEAAGLSTSQLERTLHRWVASYALTGPGLRSVTRRLRLKTALLFLSAEDVPITEISKIAGYGSVEAMGRAFRDANLPAPSAIRKELVLGT